jgi:quercetin dioxygenase-like cupin family protein
MIGKRSDLGYVKIADGIEIKTLNYGAETLMTEFLLKKNASLPEHQHPYEQTGYLIHGEIKLFIGESSRIMKPGDSWNIPSNVKHKAEILEDSKALEIFCPRRDDYLKYVCENDIVD